MRKCKKMAAGLFAALIMMSTAVSGTELRADAKTYTVTFRAGNVGAFDLDKVSDTDKIEVEENYIKFTVERGTSVSQFFGENGMNSYFLNITNVDTGYRLKNVTELEENIATKEITRNTEYVLDYGKLVAPVAYSIEFVDAESKEQIAAPTIAYGNEGDEILCEPLLIADYSTKDKAQTITLEEGKENTVTFSYTYTGETETVTDIITTVVPGDVITNEVINEIPAEVPVAENVTPGNDAGNVTIEDANVPLADGDNNNVEIEDEDVPLADGNNGNVEIEEEDVPLTDGNDKTIEEEEVPLASGTNAGVHPVIPAAVAGVAVVSAVAAILTVHQKKKRNAAAAEKTKEK